MSAARKLRRRQGVEAGKEFMRQAQAHKGDMERLAQEALADKEARKVLETVRGQAMSEAFAIALTIGGEVLHTKHGWGADRLAKFYDDARMQWECVNPHTTEVVCFL